MKIKTKENYSHLASTLTHDQLVKNGWRSLDGKDGVRQFLSKKHKEWTPQQFMDRSRYGTFPPGHRFGGSRLAPVYFRASEVAFWIQQQYAHTEDAHLVLEAAKAGFVIEASHEGIKTKRGQWPYSRPASESRKKSARPPVTLRTPKKVVPEEMK